MQEIRPRRSACIISSVGFLRYFLADSKCDSFPEKPIHTSQTSSGAPPDLILPSDGSEESRESGKSESDNPGRHNISPVIRDSTRRAEVFFGRTDTTDKGVNGFKQYWAAGKSYTYYKYIVLCKRSPNPSFYNLQPPILTSDTRQANAKSVFTK